MEEKLSVSQAAEILKCAPITVRRLCEKGVLKPKRDYKNHRIFSLREILEVKEQRERLQ
jgi:DNA-binding transcriptional MerR regulator